MDFAKKLLEKYGWKEGQGLGKEGNGISVALKPKLKFDKCGVGHDSSEQFTNNWWESLYDKACNNLNVHHQEDSVKLDVNDPDSVEISTKGYSLKNLKSVENGLEYGSFLKTSKLTPTGIIDIGNGNSNYELQYPIANTLTDEELYLACGKRTAHKGARHGIALNGKLSRIEKQEKLLLKQLKRISLSDDTNTKLEKKLKKIAEHKNRNSLDTVEDDTIVLDLPSGNQCIVGSPSTHKSKKRKKERRRVSFNDTVTEYQTQTTDEETNPGCSSESASQSNCSLPASPVTIVRKVKIREPEVDNNGNIPSGDQDEGIDCTNFDEAKDSLLEKVKKDNKKMKRKLKKLRSLTAIQESSNHLENNCIKRKLFNESEECDAVQFKKLHYDLSNIKLTKKQRKHIRKQKRMEKRVNKVAESLDHFCKI